MKERIALFTPFCRKSIIGRLSDEVCRELVKYYDIDIWTSDREDLISSPLNVVQFCSEDDYSSILEKYDHLIYEMGNFVGYHGDIFKMSKKYPGIMILHDQTYIDFILMQCLMPEYGGNVEAWLNSFISIVGKYYGPDAVKVVKQIAGSECLNTLQSLSRLPYNMIEPVIENSKGVFSHADFFYHTIAKYSNRRYGYSYLPCNEGRTQGGEYKLFELFKRDSDKLLLVSTGIVHPVKRIDRVAEVLCKHPEIAEKVQYVVIGSYGEEYGENLKALSEGKLKNCLYLLGYQDDDIMEAAIRNADMCINLRYPNSEVFSMSLAEQMACGKPVLVIGSGIYNEIPDECLIKINLEADNESEMIKNVLLAVIDDRNVYNLKGIKAREFVKDNFTVEKYVSNLCEFLNNYQLDYEKAVYTDKIIDDVFGKIFNLGFNDSNVPLLTTRFANMISDIFNDKRPPQKASKTLGLWIGFLFSVPNLKRDGTTHYFRSLLFAIMKKYDVHLEIWAYSCNEKIILESFDNIFGDKFLNGRVKLITEKNWQQMLKVPLGSEYTEKQISTEENNLYLIAREYSQAKGFIPYNLWDDAIVGADRPIYLHAPDMAVSNKYYDFVKEDPLYKSRMLDILYRAENFARINSIFFSTSYYVRNTQIINYIKNIYHKDSKVAYQPVNIPENAEAIYSEKDVRDKFGLKGPYMFYPAQNRPNKNIILIIKTLHILRDKFPDLKMVLTGNPKDIAEVENAINDLGVGDMLVLLSDITNEDLFSLYCYAALVPIPSLMEGGFPQQACEALFFKVPVALGLAPFVEEQIEDMGFTRENCGLSLFDPYDETSMANAIRGLLGDRAKAVKRQARFRERMLGYTWDYVAEMYYKEIFER